ncbi:MAG: FHA domain-containing protein [Pirellulaceae bacterium]|nr:FHA domain-containing protein [Pirellulaceae bacterium]
MFALKLVEVPEGTATTLVGKVLKLKTLPATIGRGKDATIVVQHRKLSRLHCRFYVSDEKLHVRDLGSTNGTTVNGSPVIGAEVLREGDMISAGGVVFQLGRFVSNADFGSVASDSTKRSGAAVAGKQDVGQQDAKPTPQVGTSNRAVEPAPESVGTETVDWRPAYSADSPLVVSPLEIEPTDPKDPTAQMVPVSAIDPTWKGPTKVTPVSSVQIESSRLGKAGSVDPSELPDFSEVPKTEIDPSEIDLTDVAPDKKDASVTALGNFFSKQNLRRS